LTEQFKKGIVNHCGSDVLGLVMATRILGFLIVAATLVVGSVAPASAEFFGCNEPRVKVSSYSSAAMRHYAQAPAPRRAASQRRYAAQQRTSFWH
jgi:hypothetical protein